MGRARWEFLRRLIFVNAQHARAGRVQGSSQGSRVIFHRGIATAVGVKEWRQETTRRIEAGDRDGTVNITLAAAVPFNSAFPKNQNEAIEIRVATHAEGTRDYQ